MLPLYYRNELPSDFKKVFVEPKVQWIHIGIPFARLRLLYGSSKKRNLELIMTNAILLVYITNSKCALHEIFREYDSLQYGRITYQRKKLKQICLI